MESFDCADLFDQQSKLDNKIFSLHKLDREKTVNYRILAFIVEVGELANEIRSFKYWSRNKTTCRKKVIEEYVDGLHFLLSLAIDVHDSLKMSFEFPKKRSKDLTLLFLEIFELGQKLRRKLDPKIHQKLFMRYLELGSNLDFSAPKIRSAYLDKNKINHARQENNY